MIVSLPLCFRFRVSVENSCLLCSSSGSKPFCGLFHFVLVMILGHGLICRAKLLLQRCRRCLGGRGRVMCRLLVPGVERFRLPRILLHSR